MSRSYYGGTSLDWLFKPYRLGDNTLAALRDDVTTLTFWSAATGGTNYVDLLDSAGAATGWIVVNGYQVPEFRGPDGVTAMWADKGDGTPRERMEARDQSAVASAVTAAQGYANAAAASAAAAAGGAASAVLYTSQSLTGTQQGVARGNVGAAAQSDLDALTTVVGGKASTSHTHALANLSDVTISGPTNGQALTYSSSLSKWVNTASGSGLGGTKLADTANQTAMLALSAGLDDWTYRTDTGTVWRLLRGSDPTVLANWVNLGAGTSTFTPAYATDHAGQVFFVVGLSTAPRPTARTDLLGLWITTDGLPPVNKAGNDVWLNAQEAPA